MSLYEVDMMSGQMYTYMHLQPALQKQTEQVLIDPKGF
jgi:hypothetical protein